ncbi:hypothetical protein C8R48DRAFT_676102 [Suillus tomentosus]|nr:hypothetical protein C8R48DRAFT_676102 [Suillus tomentosus]
MSMTDAPRCTCPLTATARPAKILLNTKIKRQSLAQKAADDLVIKEAREAKEAAHQKGVEYVAALQAEMEKATPVWPKPRAKAIKPKAAQTKSVVGDTGGGDSPADSGLLEDPVLETDVARDVENKAAGRGKKMVMKKVAKTSLIRDTISNVVTLYEEDYDIDEPKVLLEASDKSDDELMAPLTQVLPEKRYSQEPKVPFTPVDNHTLLKQKASILDDEESLVSQWSMEIDGNAELVEDAIMSSDLEAPLPVKTNTAKKEKILHTTYLVRILALIAEGSTIQMVVY